MRSNSGCWGCILYVGALLRAIENKMAIAIIYWGHIEILLLGHLVAVLL